MNRRIVFAVILLIFAAPPLHAFLGDSDPRNYFFLMDRAPLILRAQVGEFKNPTQKRDFYLYRIKIQEALAGKSEDDSPWVLQESVFPNQQSIFPKGDFVIFLAPLPDYTAYAVAKAEGVKFRLFGAEASVFALPEENRDALMKLSKEYLANRDASSSTDKDAKRRALLIQGLSLNSPKIENDAAIALADASLPSGGLSAEELTAVTAAFASKNISDPAKVGLVKLLQRSANAGSVEVLKKLADGPAMPSKWAAVRALDAMGIVRATPKLVEDFQSADPSQKMSALHLIVAKRDADAKVFLKQLFSSAESLNLKREALEQMVRDGADYAPLVLEETQNKDEKVAVQAIVALAEVPGEQSLQRIVTLLDSPSPMLSSAARMALSLSRDPEANKIFHEKFEDKGVSHSH